MDFLYISKLALKRSSAVSSTLELVEVSVEGEVEEAEEEAEEAESLVEGFGLVSLEEGFPPVHPARSKREESSKRDGFLFIFHYSIGVSPLIESVKFGAREAVP